MAEYYDEEKKQAMMPAVTDSKQTWGDWAKDNKWTILIIIVLIILAWWWWSKRSGSAGNSVGSIDQNPAVSRVNVIRMRGGAY